MAIKENKEKYNKFVKDQRVDRVKEEKMIQKMKSTGSRPTYNFYDTVNKKDYDIGMGMESGLEPPKLALPPDNDPLYVEKPIGKYEPQQQNVNRNRKDKGGADENRIIRKKWKAEANTQAEIRDCMVELTGEQLQKITAGP